MTMHMWVRGERGGCGGNRGTVLDELAVEGREKEGEGVETPAYGSWHRRLDQQEGRIRGPLKHSVFGNQVFNVSGSCNGHQGYRVQTICPIAFRRCFFIGNQTICLHGFAFRRCFYIKNKPFVCAGAHASIASALEINCFSACVCSFPLLLCWK